MSTKTRYFYIIFLLRYYLLKHLCLKIKFVRKGDDYFKIIFKLFKETTYIYNLYMITLKK